MSLITISRTIGSGAAMIGHKVAEALDFELYDDERFRDEAVKIGISGDEMAHLDEKRAGFFDRLLSHKPERFRELMESLVYDMANRGSAVIVGHASQVLLHDFDCAFHVLCSCSEATRINRIADRTGMSEQKAKKIVEKADRERDEFMRNTYQLDWKDSSLYDLVINTDKLGGDYAASLIITMVRERVSDCGLDSLDAMARLSLKKKAKAALIEKGFNINLLFIEVPEQGKVFINGLAGTVEESEAIKSVLEAVKGVKEVVSELCVY